MHFVDLLTRFLLYSCTCRIYDINYTGELMKNTCTIMLYFLGLMWVFLFGISQSSLSSHRERDGNSKGSSELQIGE